MSLVTAVIVGNDESECVKLGSAAMREELPGVLGVEGILEYAEEALEVEWEEEVLCGICPGPARRNIGARRRGRHKGGR